MEDALGSHEETHSASLFERVLEVCDRFESDWCASRNPIVAKYVDSADENVDRALLERELIALENALRQSGNHSPMGKSGSTDSAERVVSPKASSPLPLVEGYEIVEEIGRGGMGVVYKGRDPKLGRELAIKVINEASGGRNRLVRKFIEEAQITGQLQHPGIVPVHELGVLADKRPYFTMKLVRGRTFAELLAKREARESSGEFEEREPREDGDDELSRLMTIFLTVCQTMAYAHAKRVVHRDLKPKNVMVGRFGEVQVMDWGLAKILPKQKPERARKTGENIPTETVIATDEEGRSELITAGEVVGTPAYMAPEQATGTAAVDERADVFSLGSILCEILTGKPAFRGGSRVILHRKAASCDLDEALEDLENSSADEALIRLAKDCLSAEPADRPRNAGNVADRVEMHLASVRHRLRTAEIKEAKQAERAAESLKLLATERILRIRTLLMSVLIGLLFLSVVLAWMIHERGAPNSSLGVEGKAASADRAR